MAVVRSENFWLELALALQGEGRPTLQHFEDYLGDAVALKFEYFWDDPNHVLIAEPERDIRVTTTDPVYPFFPPGTYYARRLPNQDIELVGVDFDWNFWTPEGEEHPARLAARERSG